MSDKLKILMVDKYYFIKGGAERYYFELAKLLEAHGHEVIPFSMHHQENFETDYSDYFVDFIDYNNRSTKKNFGQSFKIVGRMIYSTHAKRKLEALIKKVKPDLAHLHMIDHQISPSILHTLKNYEIPVVQTVHQYKLVCPNYRLYNARTNTICEKCIAGNYLHPIVERCHKNSIAAGLLLSLEMYVHHFLKIYDNIDLFHAPSEFMKVKLVEGGIDKKKITKLYYTLNIDEYPFTQEYGEYFVYYGRLSEEKGILTLLQAMKGINKSKLLIIGNGPQESELKEFCAANDLKNVEFLGKKEGEELKSIVAKAKFVIVPSEWYDNSPLVIYEAFSLGTPVVGAKIGGIAELVDHEINGLLFEVGNVRELRAAISRLLDNSELIERFGANAREKAEKEFSPAFHYEQIMTLYHKVLNKSEHVLN